MAWFGFFWLGVAVGAALACVARLGFRRTARPASVALAFLLLAGSSMLVTLSKNTAVAAFPFGLVVAMLWMTVDQAIKHLALGRRRPVTLSRCLWVSLGGLHLVAALALTSGAVLLFMPLAIDDMRLDRVRLAAAVHAAEREINAPLVAASAPASAVRP